MDVKSKNPYELLDKESDEGSDKEVVPTPKVVEKPLPRTGKRNGHEVDPSDSWEGQTGGDRGGRGGRGRGGYGNEAAFNDRGAGSESNRGRPVEDRGGRGGRGGRGFRGGRGGARGDRQHRGLPNDHLKQTDQSWGAPTGEAEWNDEQAGDAIAKAEEAADPNAWNSPQQAGTTGGDWGSTPTVAAPDADPAAAGSAWNAEEPNPGATDWGTAPDESGDAAAAASAPAATDTAPSKQTPQPEPEEITKSYEQYLAEQAEKKLKLADGPKEARKPNEGTKEDKKWARAKPLTKDEEDDAYIAAKSGKDTKENKDKKEKPRKEKTRLDVDLRYVEPPGGRGGGDRGRGRSRGDYRGGERGGGRGRARGDGYRGGRGGGDHDNYRGGNRGPRDHDANAVNVSDESAFPSLGGGRS